MLDFLGTLKRTHTCGELRASDAGKSVVLLGWINRRRDHGNLIFLDLRDRYGLAQIVLDKDLSPAAHAKAEQARPEYVVAAIGKVRLRGKDVINPKMPTGEIEIVADELRILNDVQGSAVLARPKTQSPTKKSASSIAISTCAAPRCSTTSRCATKSPSPFANTSPARAFSKSKRHS